MDIDYRIRKYFIFFPKNFFLVKSFNLVKYFLFKNTKKSVLPYKPITMDIEPTQDVILETCARYQIKDLFRKFKL